MEGLIWAEATWIRCLAVPSISREMSGTGTLGASLVPI